MTTIVLALVVYSTLVTLLAYLFACRAGYWMQCTEAWVKWYQRTHNEPQGPDINRSFRSRINIISRWKSVKDIDNLCKDIERNL